MSFFWLLQVPVSKELEWFASLGVGGGLAAFVIVLWRNDRRTWIARYEEDRKASEARYERLANDHSRLLAEFRTLVIENTQAITSLRDNLRNVVQCPYADEPPPKRRS